MKKENIKIKIRRSYINEVLDYKQDKKPGAIFEFQARLKHGDSLSQKAFILICEQYLNKKIRARVDKIETNYKEIGEIADRKAVRIITQYRDDVIPTVIKIAGSCGQALDKKDYKVIPVKTYRKDDKYWYFIKQTKPYLNIGNLPFVKNNEYESYHIIGNFFGEPIETQIRSEDMHETAEDGSADWVTYKEKNRKIIENVIEERPEALYILKLFQDIFKGIE